MVIDIGVHFIIALIFICVVGDTKNNHKDPVADGSKCHYDKVQVPNMVANKVERLIRVYYISCIFGGSCLHEKEANNS